MLLGLKRSITYGPVHSRRLGHSLGINLMPPSVKVCSFDCVYCQYGWTRVRKIGDDLRSSIPKAEDVVGAVETALKELPSPPAYITLSGHGEPSLHPDFPGIVESVRKTRDRLAPGAKTAILSNSSTVTVERVRRTLARLDMRIMKLDCGTEEVFQGYSRPAAGVLLEGITEGLAELSRLAPVTIQALWAGGPGGNLSMSAEDDDSRRVARSSIRGAQSSQSDSSKQGRQIGSPVCFMSLETRSAEIDAWLERLKRIRPAFVQVYSLDRDTPAKNLRKLGEDELEMIAAKAQAAGIPASAFFK
jgi:hypothetical protein